MAWTTCPRCGFTQIPSDKCLRCERILEREQNLAARAARETVAVSPPPASPGLASPGLSRRSVGIGIAVLALLAVAGMVWRRSAGKGHEQVAAAAPAGTSATALDLAGRWHSQATITVRGPAPRPAVREASIETDRDGRIRAAAVVLTDPGHGGAGAGYRMGSDGRGMLDRYAAALAAEPGGAPLPMEFLPLPPWIPARARLWRAVEGQRRGGGEVRYLLLESLERDYLVQAGINQTGFLSWAFFSPEYAPPRGTDALSPRIHPAADTSLRGFESILWDFSGAADFLKLEVSATLSSPGEVPTRMILTRER